MKDIHYLLMVIGFVMLIEMEIHDTKKEYFVIILLMTIINLILVVI